MTTLYRALCLRSDSSASSDGRTVYGRVVPYNVGAIVSDGGPEYLEIWSPGAFARSIEQRGSKIKLMAEHQRGRFPIGKAVEFEDAPTGLDASFYVAPTAAGEEALQLIRSGVVDSFSVAFRPIRDRRDSNGAIVRLEAALQEVSLVGSAAFPDAVVVGVRDSSGRAPIPIELARCQLQLLRSW